MSQTRARDPVARMDQIFAELSALYTEADQLLDAYIGRVCAEAPGTPLDVIREHMRKRLGA